SLMRISPLTVLRSSDRVLTPFRSRLPLTLETVRLASCATLARSTSPETVLTYSTLGVLDEVMLPLTLPRRMLPFTPSTLIWPDTAGPWGPLPAGTTTV